ncbi:MAG: GspE/PulE family protein [Candidatus Saccharibacteria bacterium]|nr:GspE/PulE family protein [Candidatus Saccharibacteria bacterium]
MAILTNDHQSQILEILITEGLVQKIKLDSFIAQAEAKNQPILNELIDSRLVDIETITHIEATLLGVPYADLSDFTVEPEILSMVPNNIAERTMTVPLSLSHGRLSVAMIDATNIQAIDYLTSLVKKPVKVFMASEAGIRHILEQYGTDFSSVNKAAAVSEAENKIAIEETDEIKTIVQDSPISKALNTILEYAVKTKASDIHIEPLEDSLKIRCRVDGMLREIMQLPKTIEPALISRIKILSDLKIDEHRIPQDGQFAVKVMDKEVDLRIAISPVVWGEQVVIRLLDKTGTTLKLEDMGYAGRSLRLIRKGIAQPNGMVLTSGPTGSGKSTSLYALIQEIKDETINIVTLEDPVEYKMAGINQIQVNADVGLTFASGLRSILRQDPDVVMVGEIRDSETARLAVQAALTGHLVFSTLHTNSAAGVLPRLLDMGIEPYLIASTVNTVIGQRLVRRISKEGRSTYQSNPVETQAIHESLNNILPKTREEVAKISEDLGYGHLPLANQESYTLTKAESTKQSPGGYKGRAGLYEVMDITEEVQNLIVKRATSTEINKLAISQGMVTMRQDGYLKALSGITSIDEVNRVASDMV